MTHFRHKLGLDFYIVDVSGCSEDCKQYDMHWFISNANLKLNLH